MKKTTRSSNFTRGSNVLRSSQTRDGSVETLKGRNSDFPAHTCSAKRARSRARYESPPRRLVARKPTRLRSLPWRLRVVAARFRGHDWSPLAGFPTRYCFDSNGLVTKDQDGKKITKWHPDAFMTKDRKWHDYDPSCIHLACDKNNVDWNGNTWYCS